MKFISFIIADLALSTLATDLSDPEMSLYNCAEWVEQYKTSSNDIDERYEWAMDMCGKFQTNIETNIAASDLDYAQKYAPVINFYKSAQQDGFPTYYDYPNGNAQKQNYNPDISTIPTYYHVFKDENSKITSIGYYWYYAYQSSCVIDGIDLGVPILDELVAEVIASVDDGAHNNDRERIYVDINDDGSIKRVVFHQHNGYYTICSPGLDKYDVLFKDTHPIVYVGSKSHGSFFNSEINIGGCGYFHDYRHKDYQMYSWLNLHNTSSVDPNWINEQSRESGSCKNNGCNWKKCMTSNQLYPENPEYCTPLSCSTESTGCLPWGISDAAELSIKGAEEFNNKYWVIKDVTDPNCDWFSENIKFKFCGADY
eukprot:102427_1